MPIINQVTCINDSLTTPPVVCKRAFSLGPPGGATRYGVIRLPSI